MSRKSDRGLLRHLAYVVEAATLLPVVRKKRVEKRNTEKDPSVYSFEVTEFMFNFMEPRFEIQEDRMRLTTWESLTNDPDWG